MKFDRDLITSSTGQVVLVAAVLLLGIFVARGGRKPATPALPAARPASATFLPQTFTREGRKFAPPSSSPAIMPSPTAPVAPKATALPAELPLGLFSAPHEGSKPAKAARAPYGRMIPCKTVVAIESNRLETPIIGLVTEDVWHNGERIVPAGAEVHGRAALDRTRERIGALPQWRIVWRTTDAENGTELPVEGIVLDREFDAVAECWGEHDGSAGLRGQLVKSRDDHELRLFAATFLASATAALQDNKLTGGLLGDAAVPAATARNAVLAGTGAVLREHAQAMREAIARDGFYLRVPAGKSFYLYVTQTIDRGQAVHATSLAQAKAHQHQ